jgi:hypothetical protein
VLAADVDVSVVLELDGNDVDAPVVLEGNAVVEDACDVVVSTVLELIGDVMDVLSAVPDVDEVSVVLELASEDVECAVVLV